MELTQPDDILTFGLSIIGLVVAGYCVYEILSSRLGWRGRTVGFVARLWLLIALGSASLYSLVEGGSALGTLAYILDAQLMLVQVIYAGSILAATLFWLRD